MNYLKKLNKFIVPEGTKKEYAPIVRASFFFALFGFVLSLFTDIPAMKENLYGNIFASTAVCYLLSFLTALSVEMGFAGSVSTLFAQMRKKRFSAMTAVSVITAITCLFITSYFSIQGLEMRHDEKIGERPKKDVSLVLSVNNRYDNLVREARAKYSENSLASIDAQIEANNKEISKASRIRDSYAFAKELQSRYNGQINRLQDLNSSLSTQRLKIIESNLELQKKFERELQSIESNRQKSLRELDKSYESELSDYQNEKSKGKLNSWIGNAIAVTFILLASLIKEFSRSLDESEDVVSYKKKPTKEDEERLVTLIKEAKEVLISEHGKATQSMIADYISSNHNVEIRQRKVSEIINKYTL